MQSPRGNNNPNSALRPQKTPSPKDKAMSPNTRKLNGFKPKTLNELKPIGSDNKSPRSSHSRHERS